MVTAQYEIARLENRPDGVEGRLDRIEDNQGQIIARIGHIEGSHEQMSKRLDDVHKLLITLIAIGGGGLITAVISLVLQLTKQ